MRIEDKIIKLLKKYIRKMDRRLENMDKREKRFKRRGMLTGGTKEMKIDKAWQELARRNRIEPRGVAGGSGN